MALCHAAAAGAPVAGECWCGHQLRVVSGVVGMLPDREGGPARASTTGTAWYRGRSPFGPSRELLLAAMAAVPPPPPCLPADSAASCRILMRWYTKKAAIEMP